MKKYAKKKASSHKTTCPTASKGAVSSATTEPRNGRTTTSTINEKPSLKLNRKVNIGLRLNSITTKSQSKHASAATAGDNSASKVASKFQYFRDMVSSKLRPYVKRRKGIDENSNNNFDSSSKTTTPNVSSPPKRRSPNLSHNFSIKSAKCCKTPVKLYSKHKTLQTLNQSFGGGGPMFLYENGGNSSAPPQLPLRLESHEQLGLLANKQPFADENDEITQDIIKAVQTNYNLSKDFVLTSEGLKKIVFPVSNVHLNQNSTTNYGSSENLDLIPSNDYSTFNSVISRPSSSQSLAPNSHPYHTRQYSDSYGSYNYGQQLTLTSEDETAGSFYYNSTRKPVSNHQCYGNVDNQLTFADENDVDLSYHSEPHMHSTFNNNNPNKSMPLSQTLRSNTSYYNSTEDNLNDIIVVQNHQFKQTTFPIAAATRDDGDAACLNSYFNLSCLPISNPPNPFQHNSKSCYSVEMWENMINSENLFSPRTYYLKKQKYLTVKTRAILFGWLGEVCDAFKMHRDTYYLAINYVDRYLSAVADVRCNQLQLLGVTALYVAAKLEEIYPPNLQRFVNVTDGATTLEQVLVQELALVKTLKWQLNEMTAYSWLALFVLTYENHQLLQPHSSNCRTHPKTRGHERRLSSRGQWKMRCLEFPTTAFREIVHITKLLEVAIIDAESLKYSSIVVAASVFFICKNYDHSVLKFTGVTLRQIENCVSWMNIYSGVIRGRRPSISVLNTSQLSSNSASSKSSSNNSFSIIHSSNDENYTIQRHRDALKYFENHQHKTKAEPTAINVPPPVSSGASSLIVDKCYR